MPFQDPVFKKLSQQSHSETPSEEFALEQTVKRRGFSIAYDNRARLDNGADIRRFSGKVRSMGPTSVMSRAHWVCTELYGPDLDGTQISVMLHVLDGFCREIEIYKVDGSPIQRTPDTWEFFVLGPEWHSGSSA
jgi:hypothetical protein